MIVALRSYTGNFTVGYGDEGEESRDGSRTASILVIDLCLLLGGLGSGVGGWLVHHDLQVFYWTLCVMIDVITEIRMRWNYMNFKKYTWSLAFVIGLYFKL